MWDGPGPGHGPRGPPFRGGHPGEMFGGREFPMPDFRGREGMNMGHMGHMGPRPMDLPPMDMRRMDGPPMRGHDMDPRDMRGREPDRDYFRPEEERDFNLRRQYEMSIRDKLMNSSGFRGRGRNPDMEGTGPPRELNRRFMDMGGREQFDYDMPHFNPNADGRREFPMDRSEGFRDMHDRPGMADYDMNVPPRDRRMDTDRRGGPPFNPRGGFDSDMDFRNRPGPATDFRGRDRSPLRFGNNDAPPMDRTRPDMHSAVPEPQRSEFMGAQDNFDDQEYQDSSGSPLMDYRSGEEMTLAEEWKSRRKEKTVYSNVDKGMGDLPEPNFPLGFGREPPPFQDRQKPPGEFPGKDVGFLHSEQFPHKQFPPLGLPPIVNKGLQDCPLPEISHMPGPPNREGDVNHWLGERDPKHIANELNPNERPPYQNKGQPLPEHQGPEDHFKGMNDIQHDEGPARGKLGAEHGFQGGNAAQPRDQDYRDIDYRTGPSRVFDYKHEELQAPEKLVKDSKPTPPPKFNDSVSQDQDYRSASTEEKVSNIISVTGIPKTATTEQILGAFAVRDGVPRPGMKIKNVVPGVPKGWH